MAALTPSRSVLLSAFVLACLTACESSKPPEQSGRSSDEMTTTETPAPPVSPPLAPPGINGSRSLPASPTTAPRTPSPPREAIVLTNEAPAPVADAAQDTPPGKATDRTRPSVKITYPAYGELFNRILLTVTGTVDDPAARVSVNHVPATVSGRGFAVHVPVTEQGSIHLVATAIDRAGNQATDSIMVTVDTIAPDISISQPVEGLVTPVGRVIVEGRISDAGQLTDAWINGDPLVLDRGAFSTSVRLAPGTNVIVVSAYDAADNYRSASATVYVETPLPVVVVPEESSDDEATKDEGAAAEARGTGTLLGRVTFRGVPPEPKVFELEKFPNRLFCFRADSDGYGNRVVQEVRVGKDQSLRDVVIAIQDVPMEKPFEYEGTRVTADGCRFLVQGGPSTSVGVVVKRKDIVFENMDADPNDPKASTGVLHNPHAYEVAGASNTTIFNLPLAEKGQIIRRPVILRRTDSIFKVECDQHNFMQVFFFPVENPYYAIVKSDGTFKIHGIPPGAYRVFAWHPTMGKQETSVMITTNSQTNANFSFRGE